MLPANFLDKQGAYVDIEDDNELRINLDVRDTRSDIHRGELETFLMSLKDYVSAIHSDFTLNLNWVEDLKYEPNNLKTKMKLAANPPHGYNAAEMHGLPEVGPHVNEVAGVSREGSPKPIGPRP